LSGTAASDYGIQIGPNGYALLEGTHVHGFPIPVNNQKPTLDPFFLNVNSFYDSSDFSVDRTPHAHGPSLEMWVNLSIHSGTPR
jgi:hypothetical protein